MYRAAFFGGAWPGFPGTASFTPAPSAITAPVLSGAAEPNLPGDYRPAYAVDFVDPFPVGGGIGDVLQARWGASEGAATAMVPEELAIDEAWWIDRVDPFPNLGEFGEAQSIGTTLHYQMRVRRGTEFSDWSNFGTLVIADGVMTAPGLTDLTDQALDTRVWSSSFTAAGLASGAYARLMGSGPIEVDTAVFEPGEEALVQNGDSVRFGVDTSPNGGTPIDNVVTNRGLAVETFTATTAGSSVQVVASATPGARTTASAYTTSTATFPGIDFASGYALVMIPGLPDDGTRNVTGVTVGGISATKIVIAGGTTDWDFYIAPVTAGAKTVVVAVDVVFSFVRALFCTLQNCDPLPTAVGASPATSSAGDLDTGALTIPADGLAIGLGTVVSAIAPIAAAQGTEISTWTDPVDGDLFSIAKQITNGQPIRWTTGGHNVKGRIHAVFGVA